MKAVILCGGQGTRLRDITELLPKPMVPIGGVPVLWHIMKIYSSYGIKDFVLCLGYKGWKIKEYFMNFKTITQDFTINLGNPNQIEFYNKIEESDWRITFAETGDDSMTGARLWKVRKYLEGEKDFCLTYGDGLADINIEKLLETHYKSNKIGTVTGARPSGRFGEMGVEENLVTHFNEKPNVSQGWINGGFMVFNTQKIWDYFWPEESLVLEKEPLPALVKDGQLAMYKHEGFWLGMDTPREYTLLNEMWNQNKAPWKIWS